MIAKNDLPFFLRVPPDYYDFINHPIPSKVNEFGDEMCEDVDVDQFCLSSVRLEKGRQYWFYQGAYDREQRENEEAGKNYYPLLEKVLRKSDEAIDILQRIHFELFSQGDFMTKHEAFEATMLLFSKVIRVLRMSVTSLRNSHWETIALLRMTTEASLLSLYFTYLEHNKLDVTDLQRWFRINISPSIGMVIKTLYDAWKDTELNTLVYQYRRMYYYEGMTLHCTIHDLMESFVVDTERGNGERKLFPRYFDYSGSSVRWKLYDYAKENLPSKIYYCIFTFKMCVLQKMTSSQIEEINSFLRSMEKNDFHW